MTALQQKRTTNVFLGSIAASTSARAGDRIDVPVYSVTKHRGFVPSAEYFSKQVFSRELSNYKLISSGDFAYATIHLDEGSIGIAPEDALVSPMYTSFRVDHSLVDADYLVRFLKSPKALATYPSLGKGSAERRRSISFQRLAELQVPLPPLPEQRRIAAILDKADQLRTQRREALAHLNTLTQSIFDEMFGDPVANEMRWTKEPLSELLSAIESGKSPVCLARPAASNEWGILKLGAISTQSWLPSQNKALAESEPDRRFEVEAGDVLFSRKNTPALVAAVCMVNKTRSQLLLPDLIFRLRIADSSIITNTYLASVLQNQNQREEIQSMATGSAQSMVNISKAKLMSVSIPVPPLDLQQTFLRRVAGIDSLKEQYRAQLAELDTLSSSLQYRAFSGEL